MTKGASSNEEGLARINAQAGIRRDGTPLDDDYYTDGEWVRFYRGKPKKMGGWRLTTSQMNGPSRGLFVYPRQTQYDAYNFHPRGLEVVALDANGNGGTPTDRTPVGFVPDDNYTWSFGTLFDATGSPNAKIICHAASTALNIDDPTNLPVWFGNVLDTLPLTEVTTAPTRVSGGCVILQPFLFIYGNDGLITNSDRNDPTNFTTGGASEANSVNVAGTKIVKGVSLRGGTNAPAGLFWSLNSLIRVSYVGGLQIFRYDPISEETSIMAQNSVIEYDGIYYWIAQDRFLMYGGTIREVPNQLNLDWFFNNLNWPYRNKIIATKIQRYGEIWWLFPKGTSTECNHAIIYNVRENTWYDTPLDRTSAWYSQVFRYPLMVGGTPADPLDAASYPLYVHEVGLNAAELNQILAIRSFFQTPDIGLVAAGKNQWVQIERLEPDFLQSGLMQMMIRGQEYNQSAITESIFNFAENQERVDVRRQYRHVRLKFTSNTQNGDYFMGRPLLTLAPGEVRE